MIRDRAGALVRFVAGSLDDPFLVAELGRESVGELANEAASLPLTGGRRVVRLREATDAATDQVAAILKGMAPALVVLEAGGLPTRSRLRSLVEAAPDGAAIACYPEEGRALTDTIRAVLTEGGASIDADALAWLSDQLGADRVSTRQEVEKLALYAGPGGRVDLDAAMACVGDMAGLSLDDALFAATEGDVAMADRALELAAAEGATPGRHHPGQPHASPAFASGPSDDGRWPQRRRRCEGGSAADILPPGRRVHARVGTLVVRGLDGGNGWAGRSGTRL